MKRGKSLQELAVELERRARNKQDYIAKTRAVYMLANGTSLEVGENTFELEELAHDQLGQYVEIPASYYDRCREHNPELLAHNVNIWLHLSEDKRMIRTLDGKARAFLSDRYRPLENEDLASAILPVLLEEDKFEIMSCDITSKRFYLKVVGKELVRELAKTGNALGDNQHRIVDVVAPAMTISNSEVGCGALSVQRGIFTRACSNLATFNEKGLRRYHVGQRHDMLPDDIMALLSDETRRITDQALWAQVQDVVRAGFDKAHFDAIVDQLEGAQRDRIDTSADVVKVVKVAGSKLGITEGEQRGVLQQLIQAGDLSRYGLHNAITRHSQDVESYDRATELERLGAAVIELPKHEWQQIALAS
jgi:hypothetical protein